jgi:hypothetical protein
MGIFMSRIASITSGKGRGGMRRCTVQNTKRVKLLQAYQVYDIYNIKLQPAENALAM